MRYSGLWLWGYDDHHITVETGDDGKILRMTHHVGEPYNEVDDFQGFITPGFIDTHIHGCFGYDTSDGEVDGIVEMAKGLARIGVAAFCPTTMTISEDKLWKSAESVAKAKEILKNVRTPHAEIIGLHLEGPVLNPLMCGVQDSSASMTPSQGLEFVRACEARFPGLIKMIDISPELDGALEVIKELSGSYVISLAHTKADYEIARQAFLNGASGVTHALNAMDPILKRSTGVLGSAIDNEAYIEVISDLHHIDGAMLKLLYSNVFDKKVVTISDSMRGAMMPDGRYDLGGTMVDVENGRTYFGDSRGLAGSVSNLKEAFEKLNIIGIDPLQILMSVTINPLNRLREASNPNLPGVLDVGRPATFNIFDKNAKMVAVVNNGIILEEV